jgi:membrane fusion protein (multidrug efflux system)
VSDSKRSALIPVAIVAGVVAVLVIGALLVYRAESHVNTVAMASLAKPVTVVVAQDAPFRESRTYVGTLRPWIEAQVGPQFISAYVDTVLVRPGATVKRGDVLATLDCRNASASSQAVAAEARAIDARQRAVADESARLKTLLDGGFVSPNEVEQKEAQSVAEEAQLASQRAKLASMGLEVSDCILRAPFVGEVATRTIDPGAFVRPGTAIVSVVDRTTVRMTFDVPEGDFGITAPGTPLTVHVIATDRSFTGTISRRSPSADPDTRTVHVEADMPDPDKLIPVNTTGEVRIEVGQPQPATAIPLDAAAITGAKAVIFVVEAGVAHKATFKTRGERGGTLYLDTALKPGTSVVTEGRSILGEGDAVASKLVPFVATASASAAAPKDPSP